jgi:prepilin-type N-terminal cleavage/methylation domain-containing protein
MNPFPYHNSTTIYASPAKNRALRLQQGFTLIEMVIYISLLALFSVFVINSLISMSRSYTFVRTSHEINTSAYTALERMTREIRESDAVNVGASTFGTSPGQLSLTQSTTTLVFKVTNGTLYLQKDGVTEGPLTAKNITVDSLKFYRITASSTEAVRLELGLANGSGIYSDHATFYSTVILRNGF